MRFQSSLLFYLDYRSTFGTTWPISDRLKFYVDANQQILVGHMDTNKCIESVKVHDVQLVTSMKTHFDDSNLLSYMFKREAITGGQKEFLISRTNIQMMKKELISLLKIGSIRTYNTFVDYFKETDQRMSLFILQPLFGECSGKNNKVITSVGSGVRIKTVIQICISIL